MRKIVCDRCRKEVIQPDPRSQAKFPVIKITKMYVMLNVVEVDLCDDCMDEFKEWLEEYSGKEIEEK